MVPESLGCSYGYLVTLWGYFHFLMADELGNEIRMLLGDMNSMSKLPSELGSWNAFARIYDVRGGFLCCSLLDTALVPYDDLFDFKLKFEDPFSSAHAAFTSQIGVIFGGYDLQVRRLQPLLVEATDDTILWNIPKLDSLDGWKVAHIFAGGFSGWSQASDAIHASSSILRSQLKLIGVLPLDMSFSLHLLGPNSFLLLKVI